MFVITRALYTKLYRAYRKKKCYLYHRGDIDAPTSFFTYNISFTLDRTASTATVKPKFGKQARYCNELMQYINNNHPTQLVG